MYPVQVHVSGAMFTAYLFMLVDNGLYQPQWLIGKVYCVYQLAIYASVIIYSAAVPHCIIEDLS